MPEIIAEGVNPFYLVFFGNVVCVKNKSIEKYLRIDFTRYVRSGLK